VDNHVDEMWMQVHSLWRGLWAAVDRDVGDTPEALARTALTSKNDRVPHPHDVDEKSPSTISARRGAR